ncbi:MAG: UDP-N-acetylglucosamine 2-epimerase [Phycisphaerales bacterium]
MIGPGWDGDERSGRADSSRPRRCAVVTGTRAEFGLLRPVMRAIQQRDDLELLVIAAGSHLVSPALTFRDVKAEFGIADSVPMQTAGRVGRWADVESLSKGVARFGRSFESHQPDWVVVLGDRIEAFAAATAASIGGLALAHIHGGDRAEGVADEAMRHAITKLAHLHLPATETSAERILRMGERPEDVRVVGSPAIDGLAGVERVGDERWKELGEPEVVVLFHPVGRSDEAEEHACSLVLDALEGARVLAMHPNLDPGRAGIMRALLAAGPNVTLVEHLKRDAFVGVLRRLGRSGGALVGNSSAGLIEAAALGCPSVDVGHRQAGRERADGATWWAGEDTQAIAEAISHARAAGPFEGAHPFGNGDAGARIADVLASEDPHDERRLRKRCVF